MAMPPKQPLPFKFSDWCFYTLLISPVSVTHTFVCDLLTVIISKCKFVQQCPLLSLEDVPSKGLRVSKGRYKMKITSNYEIFQLERSSKFFPFPLALRIMDKGPRTKQPISPLPLLRFLFTPFFFCLSLFARVLSRWRNERSFASPFFLLLTAFNWRLIGSWVYVEESPMTDSPSCRQIHSSRIRRGSSANTELRLINEDSTAPTENSYLIFCFIVH